LSGRHVRSRRITVNLDDTEMAELTRAAERDGIPVGTALRVAARGTLGRPAALRRPESGFDEGYDHALQQELILLNLIATEQAIKLVESLAPYGGPSADDLVVPAAQAAQLRIARGIPDALGGDVDAGS
jgi:hypothetical protein